MKDIFLKQSRRDKTHEVLITPHKRSVVWGSPHKAKPQCGAREVQLTPLKRNAVWGLTHKMTTAVWGLLILAATLLVACDRGSHSITGDYSYKLSGEIKLTDADGEVTYRLLHRDGQMNILRDKSEKNRYIITMNEMNGGCFTMGAKLDGDDLLIDRHEFATNILSTSSFPDIDIIDEEDPTIVYHVTATGNGKRNGDILVIKEEWQGGQSGNPGARLYGAEMTILAEKN